MTKSDFYSKQEIDEVRKNLDKGFLVPIAVKGKSMSPMLKEGRDKIVLFKLFSEPSDGSIVLFKGQDENFYISRVYKSGQSECVLMNDCSFEKQTVSTADCIAEVKSVERKGKKVKNPIISWYFSTLHIYMKDLLCDISSLFKFIKKK